MSAPKGRESLSLLYRGPLASCNYDCPYCPFAKRRDSRAQLEADRAALERFAGWTTDNPDGFGRLSVLFTPWGEALTRSWYRTHLAALSHLPHVSRVAIQTNLAGRLGWLADADTSTLALWATYHRGEISHDAFLRRVRTVREHGVDLSVGVVGLPEHLEAAVAMRSALPDDIYLWVNAAEGHLYSREAIDAWTAIDPHFGFSVRPHASLGRPCRTGDTVVSVDGDGEVRRCHFVDQRLGNLYDGSYLTALAPRPCPNSICDCHIGYVHLEELGLHDLFGAGVLERIPRG